MAAEAAVVIALTLLVRDEADILSANLDFHLAAGVDVVVVTDNGSVDATPEILARYGDRVRVLREPVGELRQREWVTRMARLAAIEHGAEWVINGDADEFWWPRGGSLAEVLGAIPSRYGIVQSFVRHFVPVTETDGSFAERMVYRLTPQSPINDPMSPWRPFRKVVHRAAPDAVVVEGAHSVLHPQLRPLRGWYPIEVLHFPIRTPRQLERKGAMWQTAARKFYGTAPTQTGPGAAYHALAYRASTEGTSDAYYRELALDADARTRALADGTLREDTRLRDALQSISDGGRPAFARPSADEDANFAQDVAVLGDADVVRIQRRLDGLELRLSGVESTLPARVERHVRRLLRLRRA